MTAPIQTPPASAPALATAPDNDSIQPPWSEGCFGLWPRSEWLVFESPKTPEQLKADLRVGLGPVWDIVTPGFKGWVLGPFVRIGWLPEWYGFWQRSHLAFRGMIKATPTGSRMTGYVRMHSLLTLFLAWITLALLYYLLAWMDHGARGGLLVSLFVSYSLIILITRIGAKAAVRNIHHHLTQVCLSAREPEPKDPGPLAPV